MASSTARIIEQRTANLRQPDGTQNEANGREVSNFLRDAFLAAYPEDTKADDAIAVGKLMLFQTILDNMSHDAVMARFSERQLAMGRPNPDMPDFGDLITYYAKPYQQWLSEDRKVDLSAVLADENPAAMSIFLTGVTGYDKTSGQNILQGAGLSNSLDPETGKTYSEGYQAYVREAAEKARDMLKHGLPGAHRIAVTTPHPTELLIEGAIDAVREAQVRIKAAEIENLSPEVAGDLLPALKDIWDNLEAPNRRQTPIEETKRGLKGGRNYHEAVPEIMGQQRIALHELEEVYGLDPSGKPSLQDLRNQYELIRLEAWEGSDQDGKELATAAVLAESLRLDEEAGAQWFRDSLTPVIAGMAPSDLRDWLEAIQAEAATPDSDAMHALVADLARYAASQNIDLPAPLANPRDDADLILKALEYAKTIADHEGTALPAYTDRYGMELDFTLLDAAIVQRGNFHDMGKRQQIRQNAEVHDTAIDYARELLGRSGVMPADLADESAHGIDGLIAAIMQDPAKRGEVRAVLLAEIERLSDLIGPNVDAVEGKERRTAAEESFFQTLSCMKIATDNPDKVPLYLIAESKGTRDIYNVFFMMKAVADPEAETRGHVEVASLLEHRPDIELGFQTTTDAMQNTYFRDHHKTITEKSSLLDIYDPALKTNRKRTVADEKRRNTMPIDEGDETREIESVKIVMWAGSDSFRGSGVGISPILLNAERDTTLAGLNLNPPVLIQHYRGAGGSPQRAAPTFATEQTRQGSSLRHDGVPEIADLTVAVIVNNIGKSTGYERKPHLGRSDVIGVGGIASGGAAVWPELREKVAESARAGCLSYEADMHDPRFAKYLQMGSASHIIKKVNFSARASDRPAPPGTTPKVIVFPPKVDPEKTRAIEFSAALAASGSCASLTRSISDILTLEKDEILQGSAPGGKLDTIAETFLRSPEVQDELIRSYVAGYVMADRDIAWKFTGAELSADKQSVTFTTESGTQTRTVEELAQMYDAGFGLKDGEKGREIDATDPRLDGVPPELLMAAHDEQEYQRSIFSLITLMADVNKKQSPETHAARGSHGVPKTPRAKAIAAITQQLREDGELNPDSIQAICESQKLDLRDLLLSQLPKELAEEQARKFEKITYARTNLERIHRQAMNHEIKLPDSTATDAGQRALFNEMYYNTAIVFECVEHAPAALREPGLARTMNEIAKSPSAFAAAR